MKKNIMKASIALFSLFLIVKPVMAEITIKTPDTGGRRTPQKQINLNISNPSVRKNYQGNGTNVSPKTTSAKPVKKKSSGFKMPEIRPNFDQNAYDGRPPVATKPTMPALSRRMRYSRRRARPL